MHWGKLNQKLLAYGLLKRTITTIIMLLKDTKVMVHLPDGDTDFFDIVAGVLQGDTLAPSLFIICLGTMNISGSNERKWSSSKKGKK